MTNYPNHPGHRGQATSKAAAAAVAGRAGSLRRRCFETIEAAGRHGLTTAEVEDQLGRTLAQRPFDPRIAELQGRGLIVDSGKRRMGRCGVNITVWVAAAHLAPQK
jgi:hypothetical protein